MKLQTPLLLALLASTLSLPGQTATASLHGTITDPSGAVVPNVPVVLRNIDKGDTRTATTSARGAYQFLQLLPGVYEVSADAQGFSPVKQRLNLLVDTPATIDLTLKIAGTTAEIEVVAAAPTVNTQDASIGNAVTQTQIDSLPFEGRDPLAVLSLQAGVTFVGNNVDTSYDSRQGAVAGARSDQTNITLDGVDNNDGAGFGQPFEGALRTPLDSIQELRMITSNSNADAGRSSGAQVVEVTRSGGNQFHGSLYEYNRGLVRAANDWFNKESEIQAGLPNVPGKLVRNTFGARVGGPIIKNRVFFFANYEGQRTRESLQVTRTVPTTQLHQGIVRYRTCGANPDCSGLGLPETVATLTPQQLASTDQACVANGTCPWGGGADPNVLAAWSKIPAPNQFNFGDGLNFAGFTFAAPIPAKLDTYLVRLDVNLTGNGNHRLFIKPQMQNDHISGPPQFPGQPASTVTTNNSKGISVGYTALLSNTLINNFRYGFVRQGIGTSGTQSQPVVSFRGMDQPFAVTTTSYHIVPVNNFVDDINWVRGKHTLQFGANLRMVKNLLASNGNSFFSGLTNTSWLNNSGLANQGEALDPAAFGFPAVANDFANNYDNPVTALAGLVTEVGSNYNRDKTGAVLGQGAPAARRFKANEYEGYIQDQWHATNNLTLTAGVRYTYLQTPYETNGTEVIPSVSLHDWFMSRGQAMFNQQAYAPPVSYLLGGKANHGAPYWNADKANFAPRLALAYSPGYEHGLGQWLFGGPGKSSLRIGYGMYYDHFGDGLVNSFDRFGSFGLATQLGNSAGLQDVSSVPRFTGLNNIPQSLVIAAPAGGFPYTPPNDPNNGGFAITWGLDDHIHTPYSHVFSAGIQRELPKQFVLEVNYVGRLARHLLQEIDLAMPENIKDKASGMTYFQAATLFAQAKNAGVPLSQIKNIPFWQNLFPNAPAGFYSSGGGLNFGCAPGASSFTGTPTATQAMYDMYSCNIGNETSALFNADVLCQPACSTLGQFGFFDSQFSSLYAQATIGNSSYNAAQFIVRRQSGPLQFQFNYTLSRSEDAGSNPERINEFTTFGYNSQIINSWSPKQLYAPSDFDARHQINANWVYQLPFGRGRRWLHENALVDNLIGGWQLSGLGHWSSGYPFSIAPGLGFWATNWQLTSSAELNGTKPQTGSFNLVNDNCPQGCPNVFKDPVGALAQFRFAYPGESGQRNNLRGPGTFDLDAGASKSWHIFREQTVTVGVEAFNVTNSVRFDVGSLQFVGNNALVNNTQFGNFTSTASKPRVLQFSLRYSF